MEEGELFPMKFTRIDKNGNEIGVYERKFQDDIMDSVNSICDTISNKVVPITENIIDTVATSSTIAVKNTVTDFANIIGGVVDKDPKRICNAVGTFAGRRIKCAANFAKVIYSASKTGLYCISKDKLTNNDINKLKEYGIIFSSVALTIAITGELLHELHLESPVHEISGDIALLTPDIDISDIPGVHNGIFESNSVDDLNNLIHLGEIDNTEHINSIEVVRDPSIAHEFLDIHGLDSQPKGYELHHIIPLSEGGADSPDNMVLVPEELHHQITAAHRLYYSW